MTLSETEKALLYALQCGLPLTQRPFAALGEAFGLGEKEAVAFVARLFAEGMARRLGPVFNTRRLGYRCALCAVSLPNEAWVEAVATVLIPHPAVTHCHERAWPRDLDRQGPGSPRGRPAPNLWFTCVAPRQELDRVLADMRDRVSPAELLVLPSHACFKFDEVFDPRVSARTEGSMTRLPPEETGENPTFTEEEREAIRLLQRPLAPAPNLFGPLAQELGLPVETFLDLLRSWRERGVLRRFSLTLRHANIGYQASGMGVWSLPPSRVKLAGHGLSAFPEVTHCYERIPDPDFPYNLSAMIHGEDWEQVSESFIRLSQMENLREGRLLCSVREFKNTSPRFFLEDRPEPRDAREPEALAAAVWAG